MSEASGFEAEDTYAPVVSWTTVRLMLVLTIILGLETQQIDFSNAFAQADLPKPVYLELPRDFPAANGQNMVLQLHKSLYGQIEAPKLWYEKLKAGLEERNFTCCGNIDPCLFISPKVICISYVDDVCWFARDQKDIEKVLDSFDNDGDQYNWEMTREGAVNEFLGIDINRLVGDSYELTQKGLIKQVLGATGMVDCNVKPTPTKSEGPLGSDVNGRPASKSWSYASVIGMLLYLASNSRPDIAFAVHQCARFTHSPKASHEEAVLRIMRYLQGTKDNGLIFRPNMKAISVDCYVDADFAGLWGHEDDQDPVCVKSRTGYVITVADCPLLWASKLQSEIALSTLEAEYIALSQSMRCVIPLKRLVTKVLGSFDIKEDDINFVSQSTVFEDNNGCLRLATCPRMTPRTKHIGVKYHFFRRFAEGANAVLKIVKIGTEEQKADIFTKGLQGDSFLSIRKLLCGW